MLRVDLRELAQGRAVETQGQLKQDDPALEGTDITLTEPVTVRGRLQSSGEGRFYWQGTARPVVQGQCRRCLTPVATPLQLEIGELFTQDPDALQDPESDPAVPDRPPIAVAPAVRE